MATVTDIISVEDLSFHYNGKKILEEVFLGIKEKTFTVFLGKNGSGKSTLLRLLAGLLPVQSGRINLKGKDTKDLNLKEKARIVGFLAQQHKAVFPFSVQEVVLTGRAGSISWVPTKADVARAREALQRVDILHLSHRRYTELSGGEQQLVMIARTLAQEPEVLLLDEPVSHLDYHNQVRIMDLLRQLVNDGLTVVAVIHDPNLAFLYGQRFVYFHNGCTVDAGNGNAWDHDLASIVFHDKLVRIEHEGRRLFVPALS